MSDERRVWRVKWPAPGFPGGDKRDHEHPYNAYSDAASLSKDYRDVRVVRVRVRKKAFKLDAARYRTALEFVRDRIQQDLHGERLARNGVESFAAIADDYIARVLAGGDA
jgi:hypothetical protein